MVDIVRAGISANTFNVTAPGTGLAVGAKDNTGKLQPLNLDASGNLLVAVTGAGSGGTSSSDGAAYTAGTTAGTGSMGVMDDVGTTALAEDKIGLVRVTAQRGFHINLRSAAGVEQGTAAAPLFERLERQMDYDTGAGSDNISVVGVALPASGGSVAGGTATNPFCVNVVAGSAANAAASATGAAAPAAADYQGINVAGTLRGATGVNPSGSIFAEQIDIASIVGTTADVNSGNKSAGTLRVTLATDQVQLTNALKVDGSATTQPVSIVAGATSIGKAEDSAHTTGDVGVPALAVRNDSLATTFTDANGDYSPISVSSTGVVRVDPSGTTTQPISASSLPLPALASTSTKQSDGSQKTQIVDGSGNVVGTDAATNPLNVQIVGNPSIRGLQAHDAAISGGNNPMVVGGYASATAPTDVSTDGDVTRLWALKSGAIVNQPSFAGTLASVNAGTKDGGTLRVTLATDDSAHASWGQGATGAAVPANAQYEGLLAQTALPSAATAGNLTGELGDKFGRQVVLVGGFRDLVGTQTTTISASTSETTVVTAGGAGIFNDIVMFIVSNTSASTNTRIDVRDTTGGTVLFSLQSIGGAPPVGFVLPVPIPQSATNTNWTFQCATSTTDIRVYAVFLKNK